MRTFVEFNLYSFLIFKSVVPREERSTLKYLRWLGVFTLAYNCMISFLKNLESVCTISKLNFY